MCCACAISDQLHVCRCELTCSHIVTVMNSKYAHPVHANTICTLHSINLYMYLNTHTNVLQSNNLR